MKTAQVLIVGNEILSGRTLDTNTQFLAKNLALRGVKLTSTKTLPDEEQTIATYVKDHHHQTDYFIVAGGIGGTPDDVTRQAVAKSLGLKLERHAEAEKILRDYYKERINESRLHMAELPKGCELISNPVTLAPGFKIKNIYVFAGVPKILQAMFEQVSGDFEGTALFEKELPVPFGEGEITPFMEEIMRSFPGVEIGSYPKMDFALRKFTTEIVFKSESETDLEKAFQEFKKKVDTLS